ncbi:DsbA family oxidoreductase [Oxalobacteraceae bacterium]|nr:DsbA family oxidoreductase [Oxalobacteraceae bacterium]
MSAVLDIEVGFDFICPWCLIGKRNLDTALALLRAERPEVAARLHWRGVQLLPDAPAAGWPFMEFYRRRLGGEAAVRQRQAQVQRFADAAGVRIAYEAIAVMPNTADAHRLLAWAGTQGDAARRDALLERLLCAYFEEGEDIGNPLLLLAHGEAAGYERVAMQAELRGAGQTYRAGPIISGGVPYFSINGGRALSGAQPPETLLAALRDALAAPPAVPGTHTRPL